MTLFGFGKKKEKEINAPVCTCNGNCSVSETVEPENLNNCCQDIQGRICCIKVLGSGSMNFEAVTARYVDVRLERKKEVLDAYHGAVKQADPAKAEKAEPKKAKSAAKKKSSDLEL